MSDQPADNEHDLMTQQAIQNDGRSLVGIRDVEQLQQSTVPDPVNRNLAMQLAIQHNPGADIPTLKSAADEFYSYLTQQN